MFVLIIVKEKTIKISNLDAITVHPALFEKASQRDISVNTQQPFVQKAAVCFFIF